MIYHHPNNILITGGAGFIGSHFVRHLLAALPQVTIINLDKLTYAGSLENLINLPSEAKHHFIQGDIIDKALVVSLLQKYEIDTIVHFAAESHVDRSINGPSDFIATNILGTFTLLEAAKEQWKHQQYKQCRFHHISTDEVFGSLSLNDLPFTETHAYNPRSPYSASKASSDHLVRAYYHTYGLPMTITNCSNNYGPYQHAEKFIPTVIRSCLKKKPIPVYGNGKNIRDWLYVADHCRAILTVIQQGKIGECYNIGGNHELENIELATTICDSLDRIIPFEKSYKSLLQFTIDRPGHDFRYAIDSSKIGNELGWHPTETIESGLMKTIEFYLQARSVPA